MNLLQKINKINHRIYINLPDQKGKIDLKQKIGIAKECRCRCILDTKTVDALRKSVMWFKKWVIQEVSHAKDRAGE